MIAKRVFARGLGGGHTESRLAPHSISVDEADHADGYVEEEGAKPGDPVKRPFDDDFR
jgi:hypothetical protein